MKPSLIYIACELPSQGPTFYHISLNRNTKQDPRFVKLDGTGETEE
jgi:hypothetical protein